MLSRVRTRWIAPCVMIASLFAVATGGAASAAQSGRVTISNGSVVCVQGKSEFNWYAPAGGFADKSAWALTYARNPGSCSGTLYRPQGWLAARFDVFKWTGSQWALCRSLGWKFGGGGDTNSGDITLEQAAAQMEFYSSPPCGAGYYGTQGSHFVWDGSAWQGGSLWSGSSFAG